MKKIYLFLIIIATFNACKKTEEPIPVVADFEIKELAGGEVQFTNKSTGATTYEWDFGSGKTSTEQNPKYIFEDNKDYNVSLTAKGASGQNQRNKSLKVTTYDRSIFITAKAYSVLTAINNYMTPTPQEAALRYTIDVTKCEQNKVRVQVYDNYKGTSTQATKTQNIDSGCQVVQTNSEGEFYIPTSQISQLVHKESKADKCFVWKMNPDKTSGSLSVFANWNVITNPQLFWVISSNFKQP